MIHGYHIQIENLVHHWFDRFKTQYAIVYKHISEAMTAVNIEYVECWRNNMLSQILKIYIGYYIFTGVKCELFFEVIS